MSGEFNAFYEERSTDAIAASVTASPGTCSVEDFRSCSVSSGRLSLACTEADLSDACDDYMEALVDLELLGSDEDGAKLAPSSDLSDLCSLIREDLQKQNEVCGKSAHAKTGHHCSAAHRLPSTHRTLIVAWMRDVSRALRLQMSTLFTAAACLDRFVATAESLPPDGMLQLLALACISVAVKFNEVGRVLPAVWLGLAVDCYGKKLYVPQDLQRMEFSVLSTLGWRLHVPTAHTFLQHFLLCMAHAPAPASPTAATGVSEPAGLSQVLASLTVDCGMLRAWPVASSAVALAEMSLTSEAFHSYNHSTVALACLALAEHLVCLRPDPCPERRGPSVAAFVAAAAGQDLHLVAPDLQMCAAELDRCCRMQGGGAPAGC